ncbi:MAG TPA: hypothetical protein VFQ43_19955 [Nitrososphaera sp.]|nr:hypothetical protein [Nitrososphaera sp.]
MKATIEHLIADLRAEAPLIPYQLHEGLRQLEEGFGGDFDPKGASERTADFLQQYVDQRKPEENE